MAKGTARWDQDEMLAGLMDSPATATPRTHSGGAGKAAARRNPPQIALDWITADTIDLVSNVALMVLIGAGVLVSIFGTYYGMRYMSIPVGHDGRIDLAAIVADLKQYWLGLLPAVGAQALFSAFQLRFRLNAQRARAAGDTRWYRWIGAYGIALLFSLIFNVQAYWGAATGWWPPAVVAIGLLVVDMGPELMVKWKEI